MSREIEPSARLSTNVVRVTLPAKAAFDLKSFQKVQASILDRLGCPACCSGYDIRFDITRRFLVDEKLNVHETLGGGGILEG